MSPRLETTLPLPIAARRPWRWMLVAVAAAALAALCTEYFAANAGADYPEPWAQAAAQ